MSSLEHKDNLADIGRLFNDPLFSDYTIELNDGETLYCHKYFLATCSPVWAKIFNAERLFPDQMQKTKQQPTNTINRPTSLSSTYTNSISNMNNNSNNNTTTNNTKNAKNGHISSSKADDNTIEVVEINYLEHDHEVVTSLIKWVYTGVFDFDNILNDENYLFGTMKLARILKLPHLVTLCERCLLSIVPDVGLDKVARLLMEGNANINIKNDAGLTLLHLAVKNKDEKGATFLLDNRADMSIRTPDKETPLELAIRNHMAAIVRLICERDYDQKDAQCSNGDPPIWLALSIQDQDIASILVQAGCNTDCWEELPTKYSQNLLHRALDQNDEETACFLIRSGCDCNSPRQPLSSGVGDEEAFDGQTPLHLACAWALQNVVHTLLEHQADINSQDSEGKTPLHIAIINQHDSITSILIAQPQLDLKLRDKYGQNAFAIAMSTRNNKAAKIILGKEPHAAEKYDPKGRTFLHLAIQKSDIESVLFLLSVHVNIQSRVQDSSKFAPLHLAVESGSEMIVRNLLLAGANINDVTVQNQTALHIAASKDHHTLCQILIENNINYDAVDADLNNALHLACQNGNLNTARVLLSESRISAEALNLRGQNPVHILAQYGKENATAIFDLFIQCMPEYPINGQDAEGNTPLLLAYRNANANLCRALISCGACLGSCNRDGLNIFNVQVASKNLLYRLLNYLPQEPPWSDGDNCLECQAKFGITNRKHHCRHCGRILCAKCSPKEIPINKFKSPKPVRVCEICTEVLTYGESNSK